eukprot:XP_001708327.1 Protein 21.1 [Giardia lamblia ATCC 50803]
MMTSSKAWFDAVEKGDTKMVRFLLQNNARSYNDLGETALMQSVRLFDKHLVQLLLDHEAGVISRDGSTALSIAATMGNAAACELLYAREAKLSLQNKRTPLILAAQAGHLKCVHILKDNNPAHRDAFNRSALDYAIQSGHSAIVNYLVGLPQVKENCLNQAIMISRSLHNDLLAERLIELRDRSSKPKPERARLSKGSSVGRRADASPPNVISEYIPEFIGASSSSAHTPGVDPTVSSANIKASASRASCLTGLLPRSVSASVRVNPHPPLDTATEPVYAAYNASFTSVRPSHYDRDDYGKHSVPSGPEVMRENVIELLFRKLQHNSEEIECLRRQLQVMKSLPISRSATPADRRTISRPREPPVLQRIDEETLYSQDFEKVPRNIPDDSINLRVNEPGTGTDDYNANFSNFGDSDGFNAGVLQGTMLPNTVVHNQRYMLSPTVGTGDHHLDSQNFADTHVYLAQQEIMDNPSLPQVGDSAFSAFVDTQVDSVLLSSIPPPDTGHQKHASITDARGMPGNSYDNSSAMEQSYPLVSDSFRFETPQSETYTGVGVLNNVERSLDDANDDLFQSYTDDEILRSNSELMNAVLANDIEAVLSLIPEQAGLQNIVGKTALMYAIEEGFTAAANALIPYESRYSDTVGITALMIASRVSNLDIIQKLIAEEAGMRSLGGRTALMLAARCNQPQSAAMLLDTEGTLLDEGGYTALHIAAVHNQAEAAFVLVSKEAGIKTKDGRTALMLAVEKNSMEAANVILPHECNITDNDDYTCLMQVAEVMDNPAVAQVLVAFEGGFVNANGLMAIEVAIRCHNYAIAEILIPKEGVSIMQYCGSPDTREAVQADSEKYTELMQACDQGDIVAAYCFKDQYYSSNINGMTPLTIAANRGYTDIVSMLQELFNQEAASWDVARRCDEQNALEEEQSDQDDYVPPAPDADFREDVRRDTHSRAQVVQKLPDKDNMALYESDMTASENSYQSISFTSKSNDKSSKASSARNSTSGASSRHNSGHATTRGSANNYNVVSIQNVQDSSECPVPAPMPTRRSLYGMQHRLEPTLPDVAKQRHVLADTVTRQYSTSLSSNKPSVVSIPGPSNHSSNAPSANASLLPENISNLTINSPGSPIGQPDAEGTPHAVHLRPTDSQKELPSSQYSTLVESTPNSANAFASIEQHHLRTVSNHPSTGVHHQEGSSSSVLPSATTVQKISGPEERRKSARNINKNSELMQAIIDGNNERAAELATSQAGLVNRLKQTALMIACERNNAAIASLLMEQEYGQVCTSYEISYWKMAPATAMMIAAMNGSIDCVKLLVNLEKKLKDNIGKTALMAAAFCGHLQVVRFLLSCEGRMQTRFGTTALMIATRENQVAVVRELIPYEHSMIDSNGFTALMIACERGFQECAALLAEKETGVVVRHCPVTGEPWTGLSFAVASGNAKCVSALAAYEAQTYGEAALKVLQNSKIHSESQRAEITAAIQKYMRAP